MKMSFKDCLAKKKLFRFHPAKHLVDIEIKDSQDDLESAQKEACGFAVTAAPLTKRLPDPNDEPFLETALAGKAQCLVTGNLKL